MVGDARETCWVEVAVPTERIGTRDDLTAAADGDAEDATTGDAVDADDVYRATRPAAAYY